MSTGCGRISSRSCCAAGPSANFNSEPHQCLSARSWTASSNASNKHKGERLGPGKPQDAQSDEHTSRSGAGTAIAMLGRCRNTDVEVPDTQMAHFVMHRQSDTLNFLDCEAICIRPPLISSSHELHDEASPSLQTLCLASTVDDIQCFADPAHHAQELQREIAGPVQVSVQDQKLLTPLNSS